VRAVPDAWTPALLAVVGACVFLYGFSKTAMPVAGVLAGPLLAAALGATVASGLMIPLLLLGDLFALGYYRQHADWALIRRLVPGVLLGIAITAALFGFLPASTLGRIIGVLILASVGLEVWRRWGERHHPGHELEPMRSRVGVLFFGSLAGMTTMAANAGGTAMTLYLVKMRVSMLAFMGTSAWFFLILNLIKVPVVGGLGFITPETLVADLWLSPLIVAGALVGVAAFRRMNERVFTNVALGLSALAATWLIVHG
jgi:uncharacterized membrane protein YfcA